jgi:PAS domain S-box-containing protein
MGLVQITLGETVSFALILLISTVLLAAYLVTRTRFCRGGATLAVMGGTLVAALSVVFDHEIVIVGVLVLITMVSAQVLSWRKTLVIGLLNLFVVGLLVVWVPGIGVHPTVIAVGISLLALVLAIIFAAYREWHVAQINARTQELAANEARYRALFEQANDGILLMNLDGDYVDANQRAAKMLGYTVAELKTMNYCHMIAPGEPPIGGLRFDWVCHSEKTIAAAEYNFQRKDGTIFPAEIKMALIRGAAREPECIQLIVRDISERRRNEQQRIELETKRGQVGVLRQFISQTSHDLRTPVSIINTSLYLLRKKLPPEYEQLTQIGLVEAQTTHIAGILDDLTLMAELDGEGMRLHQRKVDLNAIAEQVVGRQSEFAQQKQVTLKFEGCSTGPLIYADESQLVCALQKLVINALNYTQPEGLVGVTVRQRGPYVVVEVRDNGIGIAPESLPRIFDRFYRGDLARPAERGGVGLGLTIANKIVEMHNGRIEVESQPAQGSCFRIVLPILEQAERLETPA